MNSKVKENAVALRAYLQSMDYAISKAENGSEVEDGYFMEKLEKMADCFGYILIETVDYPVLPVEL